MFLNDDDILLEETLRAETTNSLSSEHSRKPFSRLTSEIKFHEMMSLPSMKFYIFSPSHLLIKFHLVNSTLGSDQLIQLVLFSVGSVQ